jgi:hypothetical protein
MDQCWAQIDMEFTGENTSHRLNKWRLDPLRNIFFNVLIFFGFGIKMDRSVSWIHVPINDTITKFQIRLFSLERDKGLRFETIGPNQILIRYHDWLDTWEKQILTVDTERWIGIKFTLRSLLIVDRLIKWLKTFKARLDLTQSTRWREALFDCARGHITPVKKG